MKLHTVLLCLMVVGCSQPDKDALRIGVDFPLSGGLSMYGTPLLEGLQLGVDEINQNGGVNGKQIQLVVEDNEGKPAIAATAAEKLIAQDDVAMLVSTIVGPTGAIAPVTERNKKVLLYAAAANTFAEQNKFVFKDSIDAYQDCSIFAEHFKSKVAMFGAYGEFTDKCFEAFKEKGIVLQPVEHYTKGVDVDYLTSIHKIKFSDPKAVVISAYSDDCPRIWKVIQETGLDSTFLLPFTQTGCGEKPQQIPSDLTVIGGDFIVDRQSPEFVKFIEGFRQKYSKEPSLLFFTALGYDWAHYLAKAFEQCPELDTECLANAIEKTNHKGAWGNVKFSDSHTTIRPRELVKLDNGRFVRIKEV